MQNPNEIVEAMCDRYSAAVSANDSLQYRQLFCDDAIRVPPGSEPEYGPDAIGASEQSDYDVSHWTVSSRPLDAFAISEDWVGGIAEASVTTVDHADGKKRNFLATKFWLLHRQQTGDWLIKRQMWNLK